MNDNYICPCGYVYSEAREGKPFSALSEEWRCPVCGAAKIYFGSMNMAK